MKRPGDIVEVLYGSETFYKNVAAYCKLHHKFLTVKQIKHKGCLGKQCKKLCKIEEHSYWAFREQKKVRKKEK